MAPTKSTGQNKQNNVTAFKRGITTRSQNSMLSSVLLKQSNIVETRGKRKADASPLKDKITKRSALGNITNAIGKSLGGQNHAPKKAISQSKLRSENNIATGRNIAKASVVSVKPKPAIRAKAAVKKTDEKMEMPNKIVNIRSSLDLEKSDNSLYVSALEEVTDSMRKTLSNITKSDENEENVKKEETSKPAPVAIKDEGISEEGQSTALLDAIPERKLPTGIQWDFDAENWLDPLQVSQYTMDIFTYLKERESLFPIGNYMEKQVCLTRLMRALLVDWMVEVQESFELNHETLYLGVKLVDLYLTKVTVVKETLQLLGAASLFIASKYDERIPPMVEDFLYICDGAYSQVELIKMEISILKIIDFDLGIPLSYRFLRRYARCGKVSMPTLTLARYILEYALMDYAMIKFSDSKMAAAALLLALQMKDLGGWNPTLEYYSGYKVHEIKDICNLLNECLHKKYSKDIKNVRNKYDHKIFFEVAKLPLKKTLDI